MRTLSASEARSNLYRLMDQTAESHQPIVITGRRHDAVLVSAEDWGAIQETLYLLSVPGMRESIKEGLSEPIEACARELDWWPGKSSSRDTRRKTLPNLPQRG